MWQMLKGWSTLGIARGLGVSKNTVGMVVRGSGTEHRHLRRSQQPVAKLDGLPERCTSSPPCVRVTLKKI